MAQLCMEVRTVAFFEEGIGFTRTWSQDLNRKVVPSAHFPGNVDGTIRPIILQEVAALCAFRTG